MTQNRPPRQRDIAQLANVSQSVVSMVLNGRAEENGIATATKERVLAALADANYVPNVAARSLRAGRNGLIGVHTFEPVFPVDRDDFYNDFLQGIEAQAVTLGLDLVLFSSIQRPDGTTSIYGRGSNRLRLADGTVMLGHPESGDELVRLSREGYPFVFIGQRDFDGARIPYVTADYTTAMKSVAELLASRGHRQVAYAAASGRHRSAQDRLDGLRHYAAGAFGLDVHTLDPVEISAEWVTARLRAGATAIIAETADHARALEAAFAAAGLDVPHDVSAVCLDADPDRSRAAGWSHVATPRLEMGRRAVSLLQRVIDSDSDSEPLFEVIPCTPPNDISVAPPPR